MSIVSQPSVAHAYEAALAGFCAGWGGLHQEEQPDVFDGADSLSPAVIHQACRSGGTLSCEVIQCLVATIHGSSRLPCYMRRAFGHGCFWMRG